VDTAPKASDCFLGGTQEIFGVVSEDLLGGTGKAEDVKLQGAGIIPKQCPMERVEWRERTNESRRVFGGNRKQITRETRHPDELTEAHATEDSVASHHGMALQWFGRKGASGTFTQSRASGQRESINVQKAVAGGSIAQL